MHFAYMQIKALWTVLLSRFDLDLVSPPPAPDYGSWVTGPRPPCRVRYRRRPIPFPGPCDGERCPTLRCGGGRRGPVGAVPGALRERG